MCATAYLTKFLTRRNAVRPVKTSFKAVHGPPRLALGQISSRLLGYHVSGIPGGPVLVMQPPRQIFLDAMPIACLVLAVGGFGTPKSTREVAHGSKCPFSGVDPAGQPRRDLLDQPRIAVGVAEREE